MYEQIEMNNNQIHKSILSDIATNYFKSWETKKVEDIISFLSFNIILIEKNKIFNGLGEFLNHNSEILDKHTVKMFSINIFVDCFTDTVVGELQMDISGEIVNVVEILSFNEDMQITKIIAYSDTN